MNGGTPNFPLRRRRASCPAPVPPPVDAATFFTLDEAQERFFKGKPQGWLKRNWHIFKGGFAQREGTVWFHHATFVAKNF